MLKISQGKNGAVASGNERASKAGIEILKKGGNAIDAAVAVGFVLGVCAPNTSGIGGGGFLLARINQKDIFIDFREISSKNAHKDMWDVDINGKIKNKQNSIGGKSVCVPGELHGLNTALEKFGTMRLEDVLKPAIDAAENGYKVNPMLAKDIKLYEKYLKKYKGSRELFYKKGVPYENGEIIKNENLAESLKLISKKGIKEFYKGSIRDKILKTLNKDGGILNESDFQNYKCEIKEPIYGKYRGYDIISSSPPSSGGTHLIQILNILENFNIGDIDLDSAEYIHIFSEIFKICYGDRAKHMGDTSVVDVPIRGLISKKYSKEISNNIAIKNSTNYSMFDPWHYEHEDTTHYSVGDSSGNMVAVTKTINHFMGSCIVAEGTGILLNDQMADFSNNSYGPNGVESLKKPLSSMSPTIILKEGKPFMAIGTPGGSRIISTIAQVISKVIDHNMSIDESLNSPRIFDNTKCVLNYENRFEKSEIIKLERMGHNTKVLKKWDRKVGAVQAIQYKDGKIIGAADKRRDGVVNCY